MITAQKRQDDVQHYSNWSQVVKLMSRVAPWLVNFVRVWTLISQVLLWVSIVPPRLVKLTRGSGSQMWPPDWMWLLAWALVPDWSNGPRFRCWLWPSDWSNWLKSGQRLDNDWSNTVHSNLSWRVSYTFIFTTDRSHIHIPSIYIYIWLITGAPIQKLHR